MQLYNRKFFYSLYPREGKESNSLFHRYPRAQIGKDALICRLSHKIENKNGYKKSSLVGSYSLNLPPAGSYSLNLPPAGSYSLNLFTLFDSVNHLCKFMLKLPEEKRCFYEAIIGERPQKPHFDIDISPDNGSEKEIKNSHRIINDLIRAIIQTLDEHNVYLNLDRDIIVYTSHSSNTPKDSNISKIKKSYHLVINNWCHASNKEAKEFYKLVIGNMNPEYVKFIDHMVYSTTQQFRILGNRKIGTDRVKTLCRKWKYKNPRNGYVKVINHELAFKPKSREREYVAEITESLVSCVHYCSFLPSFIPEVEDGNKNINYGDNIEIFDSDVISAIQLLEEFMIKYTSKRFPFELYRVTGTLIAMNRIRSSFCPLCEREHDNDNIYLTIHGTSKTVNYHCYRYGESGGIYLGSLEDEDSNISQHILDKIMGMVNDDNIVDKDIAENKEGVKPVVMVKEDEEDKDIKVKNRPDISLIQNISRDKIYKKQKRYRHKRIRRGRLKKLKKRIY